MQTGLLGSLGRSAGHYKQLCRRFHVNSVLRINPNNVTEVRIPVPWGHIAGKWWGDTSKQPILALHGWQDNAGTFDPLLELLPDSMTVLAIDSPGHGLSSHYPEGMFYHITNYVITCRRIQKYFKWEKNMTILGHSQGGVVAFIFSALYPESVKALITIDVAKPLTPRNSKIVKIGETIDKTISKSRRKSGNNPGYTREEVVKRWVDGTKGSLTVDAVQILMRRGVQLDKVSGKYSYTRDPKLKIYSMQEFDENQSLEMARKLNCHFMALRCSNSKFFEYNLKHAPTFIDTVTESAKSFQVVTVEGGHHAHLTNPEGLVPVIVDFLRNLDL